MPTRLDAEALHRAAATLPPAIEVNAIEDCTVEGRVHRKSRPSTIGGANNAEASGRGEREQGKGGGENHQVQPPVRGGSDDCRYRRNALQKEQEPDRRRSQSFEKLAAP